jgi:phage internal scaffolding protein
MKVLKNQVSNKFKNPYEEHKPCFFNTIGESLTQQHFQEECDIINIIKRHDRNGIIEHVQRGQARYGDFSEVTDYREALDLVQDANNEFMKIPADIRKQFNNNPGEFLNFVNNPENEEEMIQMGFVKKSEDVSSSTETAIPKASEPSVAQDVSE